MEGIMTIFTEHATTWILGLFFSALTYLINKLVHSIIKTQEKKREQIEDESEEQKNIKLGVLALLRFRINRICSIIKEKECMTSDERYDLSDMFHVYETLGRNGKTKMEYEYIMKKYEVKD